VIFTPASPNALINNHLQGRLTGVFFIRPGRRQDLGELGGFALKNYAREFVKIKTNGESC
jgi:hypothetical protein